LQLADSYPIRKVMVYVMYVAARDDGKELSRNALLVSIGKRSLYLDFDKISRIKLEHGLVVFLQN